MSFNYAGSDAGKAATLALFTGIIEFIMGFLNLGNTKLLETVYWCLKCALTQFQLTFSSKIVLKNL